MPVISKAVTIPGKTRKVGVSAAEILVGIPQEVIPTKEAAAAFTEAPMTTFMAAITKTLSATSLPVSTPITQEVVGGSAINSSITAMGVVEGEVSAVQCAGKQPAGATKIPGEETRDKGTETLQHWPLICSNQTQESQPT